MKSLILILVVLLCILCLPAGVFPFALPNTPAMAATGGASVSIQVDSPAQVAVGSDFEVSINIGQVEKLDTIVYTVSFNANILRFDAILPGLLGTNSFPVKLTNMVTPGNLSVIQNYSGVTGVSGSGYLAKLRFHVIATSPQTTNIGLSNVSIADKDAQPITPVVSGDINIMLTATTTPAPTTTTPTPTTTTTPTPTSTVSATSSPTTSTSSISPPPPPAETTSPPPTPTFVPTPVIPGKNTAAVGDIIDREGKFTKPIAIISDDKSVLFSIGEGAVGMTKDKDPLTEISIAKSSSPQTPPSGYSLVGGGYDFGPEGAFFVPSATISITYNDNAVPSSSNEKGLVLAFWNKDAKRYDVIKNSRVDTLKNTVTAEVEHFTLYSILAPPKPAPAAFNIMDLAVTPSEVAAGENVSISALVVNKGGSTGTYQALLKINNVSEKNMSLELAPGESKRASFTISKTDKGKYTVNLNGLAGEFNVIATAVSTLTPATPTKSAQPLPTAKPRGNFFKQLLEKRWIWGVIAGLVVITVLVLDRSSKKKPK